MNRKHTIWNYVNTAIFALIFILVGCPSPPNDNKGNAISIKNLKLDTTEKTLTLSLNKNPESVKNKSNIIVYKKSAEGTPPLKQNDFTVSTVNDTLVIVLTNTLTAGDTFYVTLQKDAITYAGDSTNTNTITSSTVTIPTLFVTAIAIDKSNNILTLTFNTEIQNKDDSKIKIHKGDTVLESTQYIIGKLTKQNDVSTLKITLTKSINSEIYTVKFQDGAFTVDATPSAVFTIAIDTSGPGFVDVKDAIKLDVIKKTLTISFNKPIAKKTDAKIDAIKKPKDGAETVLTCDKDYTITMMGANIVVTLKTATLNEGDTYKVRFKPDAVQGTNSIGNTNITTNAVPVLLPPALASQNLVLKEKNLTATFKTPITITNKNKIEVYKNNKKLTLTNDYTITTKKTNIVVTLKTAKLNEGDTYKVRFQTDAVQGTNSIGNAKITTNAATVLFPPALSSQNLVLKGNTLTATFKKPITITNKNKIEVYKNNKKLTLNNNYTITIKKTNIIITLKTAKLNEGDTYKVRFKPDALQGTNTIGNANITTNAVTVLLPALASQNLVLKENTLTATFKKPITIINKNKIEVYKNNKKLTLTNDYTITIKKTNIVVTLKTAKLNEGDTYKVRFQPGAVQGTNSLGNPNITTNAATVLLPPALASQNLVLKRNTLTATFKKPITITNKNKIEVYKNNKKLTLANDYTVTLDADDTTKVRITLTAASTLSQTYQVKFLSNAVQDTATAQPNGKLDTKIYTVRYIWTKETAGAGRSARWSAREEHTTVVFKDKLWVLGGYVNNRNYKNDVWSSNDGKTWKKETAKADWSGRSNHTTVVFKDKLWVIGGKYRYGYKNDVWSSNDGKVWKKEIADVDWLYREGHTTVVFKEKLWVLGGRYENIYKNDVWSSNDGKTWTKETADANWSAREEHTTVVFKDKLWVLGGGDGGFNDKNDVWSSNDGKTWKQETSARWSGRSNHTTVVFKDKLWVLGGYLSNSKRENDVWSSNDGKTWKQETSARWSIRSDHTAVVFKDKLWVLGGYVGNRKHENDVWSFDLP